MGRFSKANREAMKVVDRFVEKLIEREELYKLQKLEGSPEYSANRLRKTLRSITGIGQSSPAYYAEVIQRFFDKYGDDAPLEQFRKDARNITRPATDVASIRGPYNVGHHGQGLMSLFATLKQFPRKFQHQVLDILETDYGVTFGDESVKYIKNLSHKLDDITKLRGDWSKALGDISNLDEINPNLRELLKPLMAHSDRFGGTKSIMPSNLVEGMTDPRKVAEMMVPWVDQNQAGLEQSIATSKVIEKYGMKDGKILKDNFKPGGAVETQLKNLKAVGTESPIITGKPRSKLLRNTGLKIVKGSAVAGAFSVLNQPSMHAAGTGINALQQGDTETAKAQIKPFVKGVRDDLGWQAGLALAGGVAAKNATVKGLGTKILGGPVGWAAMAHGVYQAADAFTQGYSGRDIGDHLIEKTGYANILKLERQVDNKGKVTYEKNAEAKAAKQRLFDVLRARQEKSNSEL